MFKIVLNHRLHRFSQINGTLNLFGWTAGFSRYFNHSLECAQSIPALAEVLFILSGVFIFHYSFFIAEVMGVSYG